jgi:DNA-binding IclR family transcriptional regulator
MRRIIASNWPFLFPFAPRSATCPTASLPARSPVHKYIIPNLRNACRLLKALAEEAPPRRVTDLARASQIPATTALRIFHTLEQEGFVRKERGELRLGPSLIYLGNAALKDTALTDAAQPILRNLTVRTDETAHLAIPCDRKALIVAVSDSPHPLRAASRPGTLTDLHCSSTGKIFLAYTCFPQLDQIFPELNLSRRTKHTLTTQSALRKEILAVRKRGYSVDNEEIHAGVRCLAAPVRNGSGDVIAAIGITAAATRFTAGDTSRIATHVLEAAAELSQRLGHR